MKTLLLCLILILQVSCMPHTYERFAFRAIQEDHNQQDYDFRKIKLEHISLLIRLYENGKTTNIEGKTIYHSPYYLQIGVIRNKSDESKLNVKSLKVKSITIDVNKNKQIVPNFSFINELKDISDNKYAVDTQKLNLAYEEVENTLVINIDLLLTLENKDQKIITKNISEKIIFEPYHTIEKTTFSDRLHYL